MNSDSHIGMRDKISNTNLLPCKNTKRFDCNVLAPYDSKKLILLSNTVLESEVPNYIGKLNYVNMALRDYPDREVLNFLAFGCPVSYTGVKSPLVKVNNHKGAIEYEQCIEDYLRTKIECGATLGPFSKNPLKADLTISPLNSVPKKDGSGTRRVTLNLSYPSQHSGNDGTAKHAYLGEDIHLVYPSVDDLSALVKSN